MLIFLVSCLVYLPMSAVESLSQKSVQAEGTTTALGNLILIIQWLGAVMLTTFCLFLAKTYVACKNLAVSQI